MEDTSGAVIQHTNTKKGDKNERNFINQTLSGQHIFARVRKTENKHDKMKE